MLSDQLAKVENVDTMEFLKPMSSLSQKRSNMANISTGVYSIGPLSKVSLSEDEQSAIATVTRISLAKATIKKNTRYYHSTIIQAFNDKGKRNSSICCFISNGRKSMAKYKHLL